MIGFNHFRQVNSTLDLNGPTLSTQKTISVDKGSESSFAISPALPDGSTSIDLSVLTSDFSNFATSTIYDLTANGSFSLTMELDGGAGGPGDSAENFGLGGKGGNVRGTVSFESGVTYKLVIGSLGVKNGAAGAVGGGAASGGSDNSQTSPTKGGAGGSGGGFTGLFKGTVSQANALLIAGGGGGGSFESDPDDSGGFDIDRKADGGDGGGLTGGYIRPIDGNASFSISGSGGTQLSGGGGGSTNFIEYKGSAGSALQGGAGSPYNDTGGGGGGYFGGGGGGYVASTINGSGGGGSGFIATTNIINAYFNKATNTGGGAVKIIGGSANSLKKIITGIATAQFPEGQSSRNTNTGELVYNWYEEGVGALSDDTNITGTATTTLTLNTTNFVNDNGRKFFLRANYSNSAYGSGLTGNAVNEPFDSGVVTLGIPPKLSIISQPVDSTIVQNIDTIFSVTAKIENDNDSQTTFDWHYNGQSLSTSLSNLTTSVSNSIATEGASSSLTIRNSTAELSKISCVITNATASPSSISTQEVNFDVGTARRLIAFERYGEGSTSVVQTDQRDIGQTGALTFRANASINARMIVVTAPEEDVDVKITLGGAEGAARNGNRGGSGGISVFKTTLKKGDEYLIKLGVNYSQGGGPRGGINGGGGIGAIYHKGKLIAVAGGGGGAGTNGRGGDGGGLQVAGENGQGSAAGSGGVTIQQGTLPTYGATQSGRTGVSDFDNESSGSGRISGCTIGRYWREQGKSPCEDVGLSQFRSANGSINSESFTIERGYKSGQGHRNNGGAGSGNQGGGGAGARGGTGATNNGAGGGGASGYASDEVELLPSSVYATGTILGGNDDVAFISFEAFVSTDDHIPLIPPNSGTPDSNYRTVFWSVSRNAGDSNTVTFTKQSGIGPDSITFGPNGGTVSSQISSNAVYTRTSSTASGGRGLSFRLSGSTLQLDDNLDNDFNDLEVTPSIGRFTSDSRWEANW